jgi:serine/threonine protein kinase
MPMTTTSFPAASDYYKAVQAPARVFTVPELQSAQFVWDALGPTLARGSSAVVFQATVAGSPQAVRCYIRNDASSRDRYSALGAYLASHDLSPYVSGTTWLDSAIRVKGETWPVLQMGWIDGRTLNEYVDFLVAGANAAALATLAARWREMVALLQESDFAHGDLQHGNVLVDQDGQLRLVDFDGVWIPQLAGAQPPTEYGHPNYQRPGLHQWGRWLDTFSALVIYLSLVALSKDPSLWLALYNSKNLLFQKNDFFAPFDTEVWKQLTALHDPEVDELARRLQRCCDRNWVSNQSLEQVLAPQAGQAAAAAVPAAAPATPSQIPPELRWWEKNTATPVSSASPGAAGSAAPPPAAPPPAAPPSAAGPPGAGPAPWSGPQAGSLAARPTAAAGPTVVIPSSVAAAASLPAPPPLSAPLGQAGTGPTPQLRQKMAPAGATWWTGTGSGSAHAPVGPPQAPVGPPQYMPPATGFPPGQPGPYAPPPAPSKPANQQPAVGAVSLGLGLVILIIGAAVHFGLLVIVGLAAAAWGVWRLVTLSGSNTKPPGQT